MMAPFEPDARAQTRRAPRFKITGKIRYRTADEAGWLEGKIKDVSKTGVLFFTGHPLKSNKRITMRLLLESGKLKVEIVCAGEIVREAGLEGERDVRAVAATIARYQFVRRRRALEGRGFNPALV